jgi:prolyl-tRNA editing enzyme YbaK/EbsC (Cys-tRNA(Pro) deacylase)
VRAALDTAGITGDIVVHDETSRSAADAAANLGIEIGQIASSIIFRLDDDRPVLVITSGRHRVDTDLVTAAVGHELGRADADFVKAASGFSIGGVAPVAWLAASADVPAPLVFIDVALGDYDVIWAAAGHPHAVFPTTYDALRVAAHATPLVVARD